MPGTPDQPERPAESVIVALDLPLYCGDCNEVHLLPFVAIERIVYALQAEYVDLVGGLRTGGRELPDAVGHDDVPTACLLDVLGWSNEPEMYEEWTTSMVESRMVMQPVACELHDDEPGPHHDPLCHYYDTEDFDPLRYGPLP